MKEINTKISIEDFIEQINNGEEFEKFITRRYIPIREKEKIINYALILLYSKIGTDGKLGEFDVYQEQNSILNKVTVITDIISAYIDIDVTDKTLVYDFFMENKLYDRLLIVVEDANEFERLFYQRISEKYEYLKATRKSSFDELCDELVKFVSTLPQAFDMDKILPFIEKINQMSNVNEEKVIDAIVGKNQSKKINY